MIADTTNLLVVGWDRWIEKRNGARTELSIGCKTTNYVELAFIVSEKYSAFSRRLMSLLDLRVSSRPFSRRSLRIFLTLT